MTISFRTAIACFATFAVTATSLCTLAEAGHADLQRVLHGGTRCDHVIHLVTRHGVNNTRPALDSSMMFHGPGGFVLPADEIGDLQITNISRLEHLAPGCGPKFFVTIKNESHRDVCGVRLSLVALFGRITPLSPNATVKIEKICAGQCVEIPVTLPVEALSMGHHNGCPLEYQRILAVIDSFDQFMECDEANNLRLFERSTIPLATLVESTTEVQSATQITVPSENPVSGIADEPQTAPVGVNPQAPGASAPAMSAPATQPSGPQVSQTGPAQNPVPGNQAGNDVQNALTQFAGQALQTQPAGQ